MYRGRFPEYCRIVEMLNLEFLVLELHLTLWWTARGSRERLGFETTGRNYRERMWHCPHISMTRALASHRKRVNGVWHWSRGTGVLWMPIHHSRAKIVAVSSYCADQSTTIIRQSEIAACWLVSSRRTFPETDIIQNGSVQEKSLSEI